MTITALLQLLRARGVELKVDGGVLRHKAPAGALTDELREAVRGRRADIIAHLSAEQERHGAEGATRTALSPTHDAHDPHTTPSAPCADCGAVARRAQSRDWQWAWVCDPWKKPTAPCSACGQVYWRVWSEDDGVTWRRICNRCRPLVVHNADGTVWRSDATAAGCAGAVRSVSQDPRVPRHPTEPCAKAHHDEWEFARSDPFGGDGLSDERWYGYVCRECRPVDQYGCWLPREAYRELQHEHDIVATGDVHGEDGDHA